MEKYSKESLEKLLLLIDEISNEEENFWFKEKLLIKYSSTQFNDFPSFLKYQKKQYKIKARKFYNTIPNNRLKIQLSNDYSEMLWHQSINSVDKFLLYAFYQLENMLNYFCIESMSYENIKNKRQKYSIKYSDKFIVSCYDSFFKFEKKIEIEKINMWAKLTYWTIHSDNLVWEKTNHFNLITLIQIRNESSHRNSLIENDRNLTTINLLVKSDFSALGYYINVLRKVCDSINTLGSNKLGHVSK